MEGLHTCEFQHEGCYFDSNTLYEKQEGNHALLNFEKVFQEGLPYRSINAGEQLFYFFINFGWKGEEDEIGWRRDWRKNRKKTKQNRQQKSEKI